MLLLQQLVLWRTASIYFTKLRVLLKMCVENIWEDKPLLNGTNIMGIFYVVSGPLVGRMKIKVLQWQLAHPLGAAEDCWNWMGRQFPLFWKKKKLKLGCHILPLSSWGRKLPLYRELAGLEEEVGWENNWAF